MTHPLLAEPRGDEYFDWREAVVMDTEANGLLDLPDDVFKFHCAWTYDIAKDEYRGWRPDQIDDFVEYLVKRVVIAHNGFGYDFRAIRKVYPDWSCKLEVDTLVLTKMLWSIDDLIEPDMRLWKSGRMPGNQLKRQGIEAWGYRMGEMKGDYSEMMKAKGRALGITDPKELITFVWREFNEDMFSYNNQDVKVNFKLLLLCLKRLNWFQKPLIRITAEGVEESVENKTFRTNPGAVATEMDMSKICLEMEYEGAGFDRDKAVRLAARLREERDKLEASVTALFKPWWQPTGDTKKGTIAPTTIRRKLTYLPDVTLPRFSDKTGKRLADYVGPPWSTLEAGAAHVPIKYTEFNLRNRHHLAARLQAEYGWKPRAFGGAKGTDPVIDEATIKALPDSVLSPEAKQNVLDYYVIAKTLGTLEEGKNAWLRLYDEEKGVIHGRTDPLGTVTHRGAHSNPNLGNIPSVELDEEKDAAGTVISKTAILGVQGGFGHECRELFIPRPGFDTQVGIDVYALELFMLGHYLYPYDGGEFARRVSTPGLDIHAENAKLTGLPRKDTKTTTYKTLYGSGAEAIGVDVWTDEDDKDEWAEAPGVKSWLNWERQRLGDAFRMPNKQRKAWYGKGYNAKQALLNGIVGLKDFTKDVKEAAAKRGYIVAIDGRKLGVRKEFAALNALLQASGSICCKVWIIQHRVKLKAMGLKALVDWAIQEWVHDEQQIGTLSRHAEIVGEVAHEAIRETSRILKLRVELQVEHKIGANWAECH